MSKADRSADFVFNVHAGGKQAKHAMKISKMIIFYKNVQCPQKLVS